MVLSGPELRRFLTPHIYRQRIDDRFRIRIEWLGRFETDEDTDSFGLERTLINRIAEKLVDDAMKATIVKNIDPNAAPIK